MGVCALAAGAGAVERDHLLRWTPPPESDLDGYRVLIGLGSVAYDESIDIGLRTPDADGIVRFVLSGLDPAVEYRVALAAYDTSGNESAPSNEVVVPPSVGPCATAPDDTQCDDGSPQTLSDACFAGFCVGIVPECFSDPDCRDAEVCNGAERCSAHRCVAGPAPGEGSPCDDGRSETRADRCVAGRCEGGQPGQRLGHAKKN